MPLDGLISFLDAVANPAGKNTLQVSCRHVADPLLGYFVDLLGIRHVVPYLFVAGIQKCSDVLECQALILWHDYMPYVLRFDTYKDIEVSWIDNRSPTLFVTGDYIFEEVYANLLI